MLGLVGEPLSAMAEDAGGRVIRAAVTETLVGRDREGAFVARLAVSVPTLANGGLRLERDQDGTGERLVATFELREDARWQDGAPITAADVRFAFDEDRVAPAGSERRWTAERVERIDELSARAVRVQYRRGERWDLYPLAPHVLPSHLLAGATAERRAAYDRAPVHAGPFAVAAWVRGYGVTLSAFRDHVGGPPRLGRIEVRFFRDPLSLADALLRGDVDVVPSPAFDVDMIGTLERLADRRGLLAQYTPAMSVEMLHLGARGPAADPSVRRALLLGMDRGGMADTLFAGRVRVPRSYLVPPSPAAREVLPPPRADRAEAAQILAAAGFSRGAIGVLERGGERLVITLQVGGASPARIEAAHRIASDLGSLGIAINVLQRTLEDVGAAVSSGEFELALLPERGDDAARASERYRGRVDPWFDLLVDAALRSANESDRLDAYAELQKLWSISLAGIPIYQDLLVNVAPRDLVGVQPVAHGDALTWNVAEWSFARE